MELLEHSSRSQMPYVANWVAHFGVPGSITTDQGMQCTSNMWQCMCRALGSKHVQTTAYHPQANGMGELFHHQLKTALRARCSGADWLEHLPWVLLGLRAAPKEEAGVSAAEAAYGHSAWCCLLLVSCSRLHVHLRWPQQRWTSPAR